MNRIRKAILAFAIFGFFGGCEAANVALKDKYITSNALVTSKLKVNNDSFMLHPQQGKSFEVNEKYKDIVTKIINNSTAATEDELCRNIVTQFLLSPKKDLLKIGLFESEVTDLINIRSIFYIHISKHFLSAIGRHSAGPVSSLCTISKEKLDNLHYSDYVGFISKNDVVDIQGEKILNKILDHIINSVDVQFCFLNGQIKADIPANNLQSFRNNLTGTLLEGCNLENYEVINNTISNRPVRKAQCLPWQIINLDFFFKLTNVVNISTVIRDLYSATQYANDGCYGTYYFRL